MFNPITLRDKGVFFKANPEKWLVAPTERNRLNSKYKKKDPLIEDTHLYHALNDFGFKKLLTELELRRGPDSHPEILLKTPFGPSHVDVLERTFDRRSYLFDFQTFF